MAHLFIFYASDDQPIAMEVCAHGSVTIESMTAPVNPDQQYGLLSRDTDPAIEARQIETWRRLSSIEIVEIVAGASRAARELALAGLRARHPRASDRELVVRLAALTLGRDLARRAYPELDHLEP